MQQMREAFPWNEALRDVLRDRDAIYGKRVRRRNPRSGDGGSAHRVPIPLAKAVCGTTRGLHPTRVPRPRYRVGREIVASDSAKVFCLLSAIPYAFSLGQRRPGPQRSGTAGTGARGSDT
jgi:hypothetical protein